MDEIEKRFTGKIRLYVNDGLFEQSMVVTTEVHGSSGEEIFSKTLQKFKEYSKPMEFKVSEKTIKEHIKNLLDDKWTEKRIINHFKRFGIDIEPYLNPQKKLEVKKDES